MKLGVFTTATYPEKRGDTYNEAMECYKDLADEVVCMRGEETWPKEFSWEIIGKHFQQGYNELNTDWVIHADLDFIFHEEDFSAIYEAIERHKDEPALSFVKKQFILPDRYNIKSRLVIAVNKGKYGKRIKFDSGGDLCQPSLDGIELTPDKVKESNISFYNYEKMVKNIDQVMDDVGRMARAWHRYFKEDKLGSESDEEAFNRWMKMVKGRFSKPSQFIPIDRHPRYITGTILSLHKGQFGYDGFGALEKNMYVEVMGV